MTRYYTNNFRYFDGVKMIKFINPNDICLGSVFYLPIQEVSYKDYKENRTVWNKNSQRWEYEHGRRYYPSTRIIAVNIFGRTFHIEDTIYSDHDREFESRRKGEYIYIIKKDYRGWILATTLDLLNYEQKQYGQLYGEVTYYNYDDLTINIHIELISRYTGDRQTYVLHTLNSYYSGPDLKQNKVYILLKHFEIIPSRGNYERPEHEYLVWGTPPQRLQSKPENSFDRNIIDNAGIIIIICVILSSLFIYFIA